MKLKLINEHDIADMAPGLPQAPTKEEKQEAGEQDE